MKVKSTGGAADGRIGRGGVDDHRRGADVERLVASNRKAFHDYFIDETYEAGIALTGTEIQSIRQGMVSLRDAFATVESGEVLLHNVHISPYDYGNRFNHDPLRVRKLLLHKQEIRRLIGKTRERGFTLVPLRLYIKRGRAKVELALAKGKKTYDRREDIARRDADRETRRALKESALGGSERRRDRQDG